jgi:hypothetical protein
MSLCQNLHKAGYQRIGLVTTHEIDLRVGHHFTAAISWLNEFVHQHPVPSLVLRESLDKEFPHWFSKHHPDVIIAHSVHDIPQLQRLLPKNRKKKVDFACSSTLHFAGQDDITGMDERPGEIGQAAIELLASLIQHGSKGLPTSPRTTLVEGHFLGGRSATGPVPA